MRAALRRIDDALVRKVLLAENFTNPEVDAYLRGEKDHPCHYKGCGNMGNNADIWHVKRRVCQAHYRKQLVNLFLAMGFLIAFAFALLAFA